MKNFPALFVCYLFLAPHLLLAQQAFTGYWLEGKEPAHIQLDMSWQALQQQQQQFAADSMPMQLADVETYTLEGRRLYMAVWKADSLPALLKGDLTKEEFLQQWRKLAGQHYRLIDVETYTEGKQRKFLGVWQSGQDEYELGLELGWKDIYAEWKRMAGRKLRLVDIEAYRQQGEVRFIAVWRHGTYGQYFWGGAEWRGFSQKISELAKQGLNLYDMERFNDGEAVKYIGFWNQDSSKSYLWHEVDRESFLAKWQQLRRRGMQLVDVETYPACPEGCDNRIVAPTDFALRLKNHRTLYRQPVKLIEGQRYADLAAITYSARLLYLPFATTTQLRLSRSWVQGTDWHHSITYAHSQQKSFQVRAMAEGRLVYAGWDPFMGNTLVLSHDHRGRKDAFRTIYTHLRNAPQNDCDKAWTYTVPALQGPARKTYMQYLKGCGCTQDPAKRQLSEAQWGSSRHIIPPLRGRTLKTGELLGWAGSTGAAGISGSQAPKVEIFVARRYGRDDWVLIDPYGIYGPVSCYPTDLTAMLQMPCRYAQAWFRNRPQFPNIKGVMSN